MISRKQSLNNTLLPITAGGGVIQ